MSARCIERLLATAPCETSPGLSGKFVIGASSPGSCELVAQQGALEVRVPVTAL
jgi:hypothetical protein